MTMNLFELVKNAPRPFGDSHKQLAKFLREDIHIGVEVEAEWPGDVPPRNYNELLDVAVADGLWTTHQDTSLRNGIEFVFSRPLAGSEAEQAITFLANTLKESRAVTTVRNGIHVHVNMRTSEDTHETLMGYIKAFLLIEGALFRWGGEWRKQLGYCEAVSENIPQSVLRLLRSADSEQQVFNALKSPDQHRYYSLNLESLKKYGTVEVRLFPTVYEADTILNWAFICAEIKHIARSVFRTQEETDTLIAELLSAPNSLEVLRTRILGDKVFGLLQPWINAKEIERVASVLQAFSKEAITLREVNKEANPSKVAIVLPPWATPADIREAQKNVQVLPLVKKFMDRRNSNNIKKESL